MNDQQKATVAEWVAALRSGDYKQGRFVLRQRGRYCCLGVLTSLCQINGDERIVTPNGDDGYIGWRGVTEIGNERIYYNNIPVEIFEELTGWGSSEMLGHLTNMNDERHMSFNKIADYIEKTFI